MKTISFIVPGEPVGKQRPRFGTDYNGNKTVYTPDRTAAYETQIKWLWPERNKGIAFPTGPVSVEINAYFGIPSSASMKRQAEMANETIPATKKPDFDNIGKIVCDALNRLAYSDDSQVTDAIVRKRYSENPRVEITITGGE